MKYTLAQVAASLPREKNAADSYWTRWVLRPLSNPVALLALRAGLGADAVSWLGALCAVAGGALFGLGSYLDPRWAPACRWAGLALLFLFSVLDCADGSVARTLGKANPYGPWTDAVAGYIAYTAALLGLGFAAEGAAAAAGMGMRGLYAGAGGAAAAANMLMRAAVQSRRTATLKAEGVAGAAVPGTEKRLSENLGITGILVPFYALCNAAGLLPVALAFYGALYGLGSAWVILKLARKAEAHHG